MKDFLLTKYIQNILNSDRHAPIMDPKNEQDKPNQPNQEAQAEEMASSIFDAVNTYDEKTETAGSAEAKADPSAPENLM